LAKGVEFDEFDVTRDQQALEDLVEVHRSRMTPTIVIGGQVIVGFDPEQLDELLVPPPFR
jgi:glutaredoxin